MNIPPAIAKLLLSKKVQDAYIKGVKDAIKR